MNKLLMLLCMVTILYAITSSSIRAEEVRLPISITPGRIMHDWDGTPTIFVNDPQSIRFFISAERAPEIDNTKWEKIFAAFRVSLYVNNIQQPYDTVKISRSIIDQNVRVICVVEVSITDNIWPEGNLLISGCVDNISLVKESLPQVTILGTSDSLRIIARKKINIDDERLRRRFEVSYLFEGDNALLGNFEQGKLAVDTLLQAFPNDCFGHAYAGMLAEYRQDKPEAIRHYQILIDSICSCFPKEHPFWTEIMDNNVEPTDAFLKLQFNGWGGARGPRALVGLFSDKIRVLGGEEGAHL